MKELTRSNTTSDCDTLGLGENLPFSKSPEVEESQDPYSIVMSAMKHVSVVSGPAMDAKEFRAFRDSMGIFSKAIKQIYEDRQ